MFESIYVPVDNSEHSNACEVFGVQLGKAFNAKVAGSHVYAAALHDTRFKQMEFTLPEEYKEETELEKQRRIHDALITRGLQLISDSYLDRMEKMADEAGVEFVRLRADGRNFEEIVREIDEGDYQLVLMGALGQGAVRQSTAGSVCERTMRRTKRNYFVIRDPEMATLEAGGSIVVTLDGSAGSWGGLQAALALAKVDGQPARTIEIVSVATAQDEELIEAHLRLARNVVRAAGLKVRTTLLDGKPAEALVEHLCETTPWVVVAGRTGLDAEADEDELGSVMQQLVRRAPCNVLVSCVLVSCQDWAPQDAQKTATAG